MYNKHILKFSTKNESLEGQRPEDATSTEVTKATDVVKASKTTENTPSPQNPDEAKSSTPAEQTSVDSSQVKATNKQKDQNQIKSLKEETKPEQEISASDAEEQKVQDIVQNQNTGAEDHSKDKNDTTQTSDIEVQKTDSDVAEKKPQLPELCLNGLYAIKLGMSSVYEKGRLIPVTVLKFDTWKVTQIKTKEKDGYTAVQVGFRPKSRRKSNLSQIGHLKPSALKSNVTFLREIRGDIPPQDAEKACQVGQVISIHSLSKGDKVHLSAFSKGRGFTGTVKRWGYGGGPASHGSQFHRKPGSIGMCEEPARVPAGKGMPGRHGHRQVTLKHVEIVNVLAEKRAILVKGGVPGARNTLVKLMKENV